MQQIAPLNRSFILIFYSISLFLFVNHISFSQVGIATTTPLSTFEVNGSNGQSITTTTTDLTLDATHSVLICNNGAIEKTITLPNSTSVKGRIYSVKRNETSTANVTIATTSSQLIDGEINLVLTQAKDAVSLISDGENWKVIASNITQNSVGEISYFDTTGTLVSIATSTTDGNSNMFLCNPSTTISTSSSNFTMTANGRLKYTGTSTKSFRISGVIAVTSATTGTYLFEFRKSNTNFIVNSRVLQKISISDTQNISIQSLITLSPNDFIEIWAGNIGATGEIRIKSFNLFALGI